MTSARPSQFCALARALEILGERWTLLVVRELLLGPKRFSDLQSRLEGVSPSVLTQRLNRMEDLGLIARSTLEPPTVVTIYTLTAAGIALEPAILELVRWGGRFLYPRRDAERFEPEWVIFPLKAFARASRSPRGSILLRVFDKDREAAIHITGGDRGTVIKKGEASADATIRTDVHTLLALIRGRLFIDEARRSGRIQTTGRLRLIRAFPRFFEMERPDADKSSQTQ